MLLHTVKEAKVGSTVSKVNKHIHVSTLLVQQRHPAWDTNKKMVVKKKFFFFLLISNDVILSLMPETGHPAENEVLQNKCPISPFRANFLHTKVFSLVKMP